jgi:hypothetical protein
VVGVLPGRAVARRWLNGVVASVRLNSPSGLPLRLVRVVAVNAVAEYRVRCAGVLALGAFGQVGGRDVQGDDTGWGVAAPDGGVLLVGHEQPGAFGVAGEERRWLAQDRLHPGVQDVAVAGGLTGVVGGETGDPFRGRPAGGEDRPQARLGYTPFGRGMRDLWRGRAKNKLNRSGPTRKSCARTPRVGSTNRPVPRKRPRSLDSGLGDHEPQRPVVLGKRAHLAVR